MGPAIGPLSLVLYASCLAYAVLQGIVTPALPVIQEEFHTDQTTVTWVMTAYLLSASVLTPILGRAGDALGKRLMLLVSLSGLALGCVLAAVAPNIWVLIAARVVQGAGGGVLPLAFGIIRDTFPDDKVNTGVSRVAGLTAVGAGVGILLSGPVLDALGMRWLFWVPLIVLVVVLVAAVRFVPHLEPTESSGRVNGIAALLLAGWLVALLFGISEGGDWGWGSARVLGLFVVAVVLGAVWVRYESRSANPLIDMRMMRMRGVWTTNLSALMTGVGMYSVMAFLPAFVQTPRSEGYGFGASVTGSALFILPMSVGMFVFGLASTHVARAISAQLTLLIGSALCGLGILELAVFHDEPWQAYLACTIIGCGVGFAFSAMSMVIVSVVPPHQTGVASGMNANIRTIGGSLGSAVLASIVAGHVASGATVPSESGYTIGFAVVAVATVLGGLFALLIPRLRATVDDASTIPHAELAMVAAGTVVDEHDHPGRE
jgi:MFS family permease